MIIGSPQLVGERPGTWEGRTTMRTKLIALFAAALLILAVAGQTVTVSAESCSPGQHGNPHPGFKPGSCDNK